MSQCLSQFHIAITEYHKLGDLKRNEKYLAYSSGCWETQEGGTHILGGPGVVSSHDKRQKGGHSLS
jgi:hypothetical protein